MATWGTRIVDECIAHRVTIGTRTFKIIAGQDGPDSFATVWELRLSDCGDVENGPKIEGGWEVVDAMVGSFPVGDPVELVNEALRAVDGPDYSGLDQNAR